MGGEIPCASSYINEWGKAGGRGRFYMFYQAFFAVGLVGAAVTGYWVVPNLGWQYMFLIGALPAILTVFMRRTIPESPRWLASVGRTQEADAVLSKVEKAVSQGGKISLPEPKEVPAGLIGKKTSLREIWGGIYRRRSLMVWVMWFASYISSYGISTWLPTLYTSVFKLSLVQSLQYATITSVVSLGGAFAVAMLIDITGRKPWFTVGFLLGGIFLVSLWYSGVRSAEILLVFASLTMACIGTINLAIVGYTPELYPTRMRALGTSVGAAWSRVASIIAPTLVAFVMVGYGLAWVFLVIGIMLVFASITTGIFGVETKNRVLEDVSP